VALVSGKKKFRMGDAIWRELTTPPEVKALIALEAKASLGKPVEFVLKDREEVIHYYELITELPRERFKKLEFEDEYVFGVKDLENSLAALLKYTWFSILRAVRRVYTVTRAAALGVKCRAYTLYERFKRCERCYETWRIIKPAVMIVLFSIATGLLISYIVMEFDIRLIP